MNETAAPKETTSRASIGGKTGMKTKMVSPGRSNVAKNETAMAVNMPSRNKTTDTAKNGEGSRIGLNVMVGLEAAAVPVAMNEGMTGKLKKAKNNQAVEIAERATP